MGDFVKYYDGAFSEAGNLGRETPIMADCWHPRVVYSEPLGLYVMSSKPILAASQGKIEGLDGQYKVAQFCVSEDMISRSEPKIFYKDGRPFGNHYNAIISDDKECQPNILKSNDFSVLCNHNGSLVSRYKSKFVKL